MKKSLVSVCGILGTTLIMTACTLQVNGSLELTASGSGIASGDATLKSTSTIKGAAITDFGTPNASINDVVAGAVTITEEQAADTSNAGDFITLL